ncbi:MAG: hypothetical protein L6Q99_06140 [Planctomycetes bacterium]|nr:hypothetical protein [Planctomycetota bacterium]
MNATLAWLVGWFVCGTWLLGGGAWSASTGSWPGGWALAGAAVCLAVLVRHAAIRKAHPATCSFALIACAGAFVWPWPANAVAVLLALGLGLAVFPQTIVRRLALVGLALAGALACGGVVDLLNRRFGANVHELPALTPVFRGLLALIGAPTTRPDDGLLLTDVDFAYRVTPTLEGLCVYPFAMLVAGALPGLWLTGGISMRYVWRAAWISLGYLCARYVVVFVWSISASDVDMLWRPTFAWMSLLPLVVLLARPASASIGSPASDVPLELRLRTLVPVSVAVASFWIAWVPVDPGLRKPGRIVIDENHSDWEWTDVPMDRETYGQRTTYNYSSLSKFLARYFDVRINREAIDDARLADVDVLVIKTPTEAYDPQEVAAIGRFVAGGGGLFLIGDHTNVFGTSFYLNQIAADYDIEFVHDATYDNNHGGLSRYDPPSVGRHAAIAQLPTFLFATSCSLRGGLGVQPVQTGPALRTLPADYSQPSFFAERDAWRHYPFGVFHQCVATTEGRGRVLAFSDSTVWSNFFVYLPGKPELALGAIEWLNRTNTWLAWDGLWWSLSAVGLAAAWIASRRTSAFQRGIGDFIAPAALAAVIWTPCVDAWNRAHYELPDPREPYPEMYFYRGDSDYHLPITQLIDESKPTWLTFFNWAQRLDLTPRVSDVLDDALARGESLILVRPRASIDGAAIEKIRSYLDRGGRVLVVADAGAVAPTASLLALGGMRWQPGSETPRPKLPRPGTPNPPEVDMGPVPATVGWVGNEWTASASRGEFAGSWPAIEGGDALLTLNSTIVVAAASELASGGRLIVAGLGDLLSDDTLGHGNSEPTAAQLELFDLEYRLWGELLRSDVRPVSSGVIEASAPRAPGSQ